MSNIFDYTVDSADTSDTTPVQRKSADHLRDPLSSLQLDTGTPSSSGDPIGRAQSGLSGSPSPLPFGERIQASFGRHDISGVSAHTDSAASTAATSLGASAFALGDSVGFKGSPDLHTAAHEAAHTVQQSGGVHLKGGVGQAGDAYERNADHVADLVVAGESAESALDTFAGGGGSPGLQLETSESDPPPDTQEWDWDAEELKWVMFWEGEWWFAWQDGETWMSQSESGREETYDGSDWVPVDTQSESSETSSSESSPARVEKPKREGTGSKVGKAVLKGLGGAVLGPFKYLFKTYRDDLNNEGDRDYKNRFLNGMNEVSTFTGYMGAMLGWCTLVMGLVAAILAATGLGAPIALALAGAVPIFGWLGAGFAAATSAFKLVLAIAGAIRTWNMDDKVEKARLRAMMWGDVLGAITQAGAAAVGGSLAAAGGGAFTGGSLGGQVNQALADPIKNVGTHMAEQGVNQAFNTGFDAVNALAPDENDAAEDAAALARQVAPQADRAHSQIAMPALADASKAQSFAEKSKPHSDMLQQASTKNPQAILQSASRGELIEDDTPKADGESDADKQGDTSLKAQVVRRSGQLDASDSRKTLEQQSSNISDGREAMNEAQSTKKPGWLRRQYNKLFSRSATKAKKKLVEASMQVSGLPKEQVAKVSQGVNQMTAAKSQAKNLEKTIAQEKDLRDKVMSKLE